MSEPTIESLQATIRSLNTTIDGLKDEVSTVSAEAKSHRQAKAELKRQLDTATEQVTTLTTERDDFKTKLGNAPSTFREENERLKGEIRSRNHKDVFKRLAKDAKVRDEAVDDLWELSKYKPESDDVDEGKITGLIGDLTKTRSWLVQSGEANPTEPPAGGKTPITTPPSPRGPGAGRGAAEQPTAGSVAQIVNDRWAKSGSAHDSGRL